MNYQVPRMSVHFIISRKKEEEFVNSRKIFVVVFVSSRQTFLRFIITNPLVAMNIVLFFSLMSLFGFVL